MPRYDVVIPYWKKSDTMPLVLAGLHANQDHIAEVYIVQDGPSDTFLENLTAHANLPIHLLNFPTHTGFGVSRCINQGILTSHADSILVCDADIVLAPNILANIHDIAPLQAFSFAGAPATTTLADYPNLQTFVEDPRLAYPTYIVHRRPDSLFRGGLFLVNRSKFLDIGGWAIALPDYGLQDIEFAAHWLSTYGKDSMAFTIIGPAWHIGDPLSQEDREARKVSDRNRRICAPALAAIFGHRYNIGSGDNPDPTCLNVDIVNTLDADLTLDCSDLSWIPPNSATFIRHEHVLEHLPAEVAPTHLAQLARALGPNGKLELAFPDLTRCALALIDDTVGNAPADPDAIKRGIFGTPQRQLDNPYELHRWGWSQNEVTDILTANGLVIDYAGPETRISRRQWRDTFIQAHKHDRSAS